MFRKNILYIVVIVIGALLLTDILLTHYNNTVMKQSREIRSQINTVKVYYDQIGKVVIHSLDIGLRGYALVPTSQFSQPMDNALAWKDSIFSQVEEPLKNFGYDFSTFNALRDSVDSYTRYCFYLKELLARNDTAAFFRWFSTDKGATLWGQYLDCEKNVQDYLRSTDQKALSAIDDAMSRNQTLEVVLFILCFPTLLYTAYYTSKTSNLSELLRKAEAEKNLILKEHNTFLEYNVAERTQEIVAQNEEITAQREELGQQRDILFLQHKEVQEAHKLIEKQNQEIQSKNETLEKEILRQTHELRITNNELIDNNNQLEQFSFIAAHNLRAPLARILGLANIIRISDQEDDRNDALRKIVSATMDLDVVVKDLSTILDIKKQKSNFSSVDIAGSLRRVLKTLEKECEESDVQLHIDLTSTPSVYGVSPYLDSILYNLISNSLKYRHPQRKPIVTIRGIDQHDTIMLIVSDNGVGVDLAKHRESIFNLYKRFHLHVEGKGLGLFLVKGQMVAMGGKVDIESELEKGTTFRLYFKKQVG